MENTVRNENQQDTAPHAPPPPSEVVVRTMASDIISIGKVGGTSPKPYPVRVARRDADREHGGSLVAPPARPAPEEPAKTGFFSSPAFLFSSLAVFVVVVFFAGYYVIYPMLNPPKKEVPAAAAPVPKLSEHRSFFSKPTNGTFTLNILGEINGIRAERDAINNFTSGISGSIFEIFLEDKNDNPLEAADFFSLVGGQVFDRGFLEASFEKDITFFIYKDKDKLWPGYILKIKAGQAPLILMKGSVSRMENASLNWDSLFIEPTGTANQQFNDNLMNGDPVRYMDFSLSSSTLAYGWFMNKYLVISTSLDGMRMAVSRL